MSDLPKNWYEPSLTAPYIPDERAALKIKLAISEDRLRQSARDVKFWMERFYALDRQLKLSRAGLDEQE
jgi:hypothetical protein